MNKLMWTGGIVLMGLALCGATNETAQVAARAAAASTNGVAAASAPAVDEEAAKRAADRALIEGLLKQAELEYTIDKDGDYRLVFNQGGGRLQVVWINGKREDLGEFEVLSLFSLAYCGALTKAMTLDLLSDRYKVGNWTTLKKSNGEFEVYFRAQVSAGIRSADFRTCCEHVAEAADELERLWTDSDNF